MAADFTATPKMRNPVWQRDELILALALYFRCGRKYVNATHPEAIELSSILNRLGLHDGQTRGADFRNANGVEMKLRNFRSVDPEHDGKGLSRGNSLEAEVWGDFAARPSELYAVAEAIARLAQPEVVSGELPGLGHKEQEEQFAEGRLLTRLHIVRERSRSAVATKKRQVLEAIGRLRCEACDFDFLDVYGTLGSEFAECHHRIPLSELQGNVRTKPADLAIVCANCHRMLHRARPILSVEELRGLITERRSAGVG